MEKQKESDKKPVAWEPLVYENDKGIFAVFPDLCKACGLCIEKCPVDVIDWSEEDKAFNGYPTVKPRIEGCIVCKTCETVCPDAAITIIRKKEKKSTLKDVNRKI